MIMVDTNVIVDMVERDEVWHGWSREALADAQMTGPTVASAITLGELAFRVPRVADLVDLLATFGISCIDLDAAAAHRAGVAQRAYRASGGKREKLLGNFLIGGHAASIACPLLTRDPRYYRRYFPDLPLITPETEHDG